MFQFVLIITITFFGLIMDTSKAELRLKLEKIVCDSGLELQDHQKQILIDEGLDSYYEKNSMLNIYFSYYESSGGKITNLEDFLLDKFTAYLKDAKETLDRQRQS